MRKLGTRQVSVLFMLVTVGGFGTIPAKDFSFTTVH